MNGGSFDFGHLYVFVCVFFLALSIVRLLPDLFGVYREQYKSKSQETSRELSKFFINIKPIQLLIGAGALGVLFGFFTGSWVVAGALLAAGMVAPKILLSMWKEIRSSQVEAQLMDALILMSNTLRSGLDVVAGIERVSTNMPAPISEEFGLVLNSYRLGKSLESSLLDMLERMNSRTLETVVYAVNIQRETGGNIIKIFEQLVISIREESKLQKKARAITSQARSQIFFLAGFPWFMGLIFLVMAPDMMSPALSSSWGQIVIVFLVVWEIIGIVVTKKIVTVDL